MVTIEDILKFSPDDDEAFLEFETHARQRLNAEINSLDPAATTPTVWLAYMTQVQEAAGEYGLGNLADFEIIPPVNFQEFQQFNQAVLSLTTRIKIRVARRIKGEIFDPDSSDREKIKFRVQQLRDHIAAADLSPERKEALNNKLDELLREFDGQRVSRAKVLAALLALGAALGPVQDRILKGPETVVAILDTVHAVIGKEDARRALLERYRKPLAIEDKSEGSFRTKTRRSYEREEFSAELDDEIPF